MVYQTTCPRCVEYATRAGHDLQSPFQATLKGGKVVKPIEVCSPNTSARYSLCKHVTINGSRII